jgi:hypothetical protein
MLNRTKWSEKEDKLLFKSVQKFEMDWKKVVEYSQLQRTPKQCRERWLNHVRPGIVKHKITQNELHIILEARKTFDNRWSEIAKLLPGRTPNQIKNTWHALHRKQHQQQHQHKCKHSINKNQNKPSANKISIKIPYDIYKDWDGFDIYSFQTSNRPRKPENINKENINKENNINEENNIYINKENNISGENNINKENNINGENNIYINKENNINGENNIYINKENNITPFDILVLVATKSYYKENISQ